MSQHESGGRRDDLLLLRALRAEETPRRPVWIMRQAGRYLPEYRALRERHSFLEMARSPALAAEVTLLPLARFPLDAAIVFADLMSPVPALGIDVRFDPGPVIDRPLRDAADVRALEVPHGAEIAPEVPAALAIVAERLGGRAALIGFAGAPWSLAAYLVEGRGGKDFPRLRALLREDPRTLARLLETLARLSAAFLIEQHRAGADVVQVFDSWAGLVSEEDWEAHVEPHVRDLLAELGRAGVPRIYFAQGAPHLARRHARLASEGLALCWRTDLARLRDEIGPEKCLQGNLDPAILLAGPDAARAAAAELLERVPRRAHVVNLGHGILPETPLESVRALLEVVHSEDAG